jgi:hypothetical protein
VDQKFPESVAALRAELNRLESELRAADATGDRRGALNTLAKMLQLQKRFMRQWGTRRPDDADEAEDLDEPSSGLHGNLPGPGGGGGGGR